MGAQDLERITFRDDLDGLDDDETLVEDPELRRAKFILVVGTIALAVVFIVVLLVFFQPQGQTVVERWPNGYRKTETTFVSAPNAARRIPHGRHRAWHASGTRAEEGEYERGRRVGEWRFWTAAGALDAERSGVYQDDRRVRPLGD